MTAIRPFELVLLGPLWMATVYSARRALTRDPRSGLLSGMIALITLSVTIGTPGIRRTLEAATGAEGVTNLLTHLLSLSAVTCLMAFIRSLTRGSATGTGPEAPPAPRRARWQAFALPVVAAALSGAFFLSPRPDPEAYLLTQTPTAPVYAYWSILLLYLGWGMAEAGRMCHRYRHQAPPGPLRTSLRLLHAASVSGLVYAAHRAVFLAVGRRDLWLFHDDVVIATTQILLAPTLLLIVAGIAWPGLVDLERARRGRRRLRRIRPLWKAIGEAVPEVVLPLPSELSSASDVLLYRRIIEISDGMLVLAPYCGEGARAEARRLLVSAGLTGGRLEAAVEAVCLRRAITRRCSGADASAVPEYAPEPSGPAGHGPDPDDWEALGARLELVARAYAHPVVIRTADALRHGPLRAA
ncbi:MAB_1171c family putative transporter [Streptomyces sp. NBC_01353]|uniref:MAB_1171c family putative transporter n=1 Tax=Streptomyces sp. NBC_01353 TaxID=2903835 RepID=UPI002E2F5FF2|nr:MAB_1171c family putative transporter [Streptomyces sp. NBC_01353]